ncbi:hypothetical protein L596_028971 [Steinernema carpocapsae]|uniref:Uncharacterized protein n=1 Tax=Steinernema carpocapsae TaxID=34508 RepID=A0A4V5ZXB4_STECR|nr:hypothetical protein L596_028971 [Steinernema carpocapsae]
MGSNLQNFWYELSTITSNIIINFCPENRPSDSKCVRIRLVSIQRLLGTNRVYQVSREDRRKRNDWSGRHRVALTLEIHDSSFWMNALGNEEKMFGIFMSHDVLTRYLRVGGAFNSTLCNLSSIQWHELSSPSYWQLPVDGFKYGKIAKQRRSKRSSTPASAGSASPALISST